MNILQPLSSILFIQRFSNILRLKYYKCFVFSLVICKCILQPLNLCAIRFVLELVDCKCSCWKFIFHIRAEFVSCGNSSEKSLNLIIFLFEYKQHLISSKWIGKICFVIARIKNAMISSAGFRLTKQFAIPFKCLFVLRLGFQ